jgi:DNA-binding CsgD family transcriptional regulator
VLLDRRGERETLDRLVEDVREGESRVLVMRGEAGVGKTQLLEDLISRSSGLQVARARGVQAEMELAFAGLHQLCAPMQDLTERLPGPQRDALATAFGVSEGDAPDLFLVALAVLGLVAEAARERPLLCVVDDGQWLDRASLQALGFVGRRLVAESVGLVIAARDAPELPVLTGMSQLMVSGLPEADARELLRSVYHGPLDRPIVDRVVSEAQGNPLALLELPRGLTSAELAGGFGLLGAESVPARIEESYARRLKRLDGQVRQLMLVAAIEPVGDAVLVRRAAERLGISVTAAMLAAAAGEFVRFGAEVRFRHPLVRSAIFRAASPAERRSAHLALAEVTDPERDPDRRAWHRAQAAPGPDEQVAADLERSAGRAQARGGLAAAAALLAEAAGLSPDSGRRADRALAAAQAEIRTGGFDAAQNLLATAEAQPLSDLQRARADLARARLAYVTNRGSDAPSLLLAAAGRLEAIDVALSRATYLDALSAAIFAGRLATPGGDVLTVARAASKAPPPPVPRASDLLLEGMAAFYTDGYGAAVSMLREAVADFGAGISDAEELNRLWMATIAAIRLWDADRWDVLSVRHIQLARETGELTELQVALTLRTYRLLFAGDLAAAASLTDEIQTIKEATGGNLAPYGALGLAAFRGDEARLAAVVEATFEDVTQRGQGQGITFAEWANAVLNNGLGRYPNALAAAQRATAYQRDHATLIWPSVELIEAAVRSGAPDTAAQTYHRYAAMTSVSGTDWALGLQARSHALLSTGEQAEHYYREAIAHLDRTRFRVDLARAHLLYGEWLRRQGRRGDARTELHSAHEAFAAMGINAFAARAARELEAAGVSVRKRTVETPTELTPQEVQIARMVREGLTNPEIAARLFISPRTVEWHLSKIFGKLQITSRRQLRR